MDDGFALLVLLAGFFLLGVPVIAIMALARTSALRREIEQLRATVKALAAQGTPSTAATPATAAPPVEAPPPVDIVVAEAPVVIEEPRPTAVPAPITPAPPKETLEQRLGSRAFAWVGALAVALAGIFLVKYSIDQGYLEPPVRVTLAGILGMVMLIAGEWLQRRDPRIAQAVSAAGVAVLFAALFAAVGLYQLLDPAFAMLVAAGLTALAVSLSLRQGPFVALLGLVGGTVAPLILGEGSTGPWLLFGYLLALTIGVLVVVRHRGWWWLGWFVLGGAAVWPLAVFVPGRDADMPLAAAAYLLGVTGTFLWATWRRLHLADRPNDDAVDPVQTLVWSMAGLTALLVATSVAQAGFAAPAWAILVLHGALLFWAARYIPRFTYVAILPVLASLGTFLDWRTTLGLADHAYFAWTALVVAGLISAGAFALVWGALRPGFWAALSGLAALLHFGIVVATLWDSTVVLPWGLISVLLGLPFLVAAERLARYRHTMAGANEALGFFAVAVTFFVSLAVPLELRREWVTMSYAIELPLVAWIAWKLDLKILRWLTGLLAVTVTIRLVFNPYILDYEVGANPFVSWVLYGYGVPIATYWVTARLLRRTAVDALVLFIEASILAFAFLLLTMEVRAIFNPDGLGQERYGVMERGWMAVSWGALACSLIYAAWQRPAPVLVWGWQIVGSCAVALAVLGQTVWFDMLFDDGGIGTTPIFNGLLVGFGLTALLAAIATWMLGQMGARRATAIAGVTALVQSFALLSYEIRHWFNFAEGRLTDGGITDAELYTYSVVWLVFGAALLLAGIFTGSTVLRYASLGVLVLVVGKVFLVDMSGLTGLLRVFSFLGLGVFLLALGFIYRRYVFRGDTAQA
jgi:uncharacterized membrane protein